MGWLSGCVCGAKNKLDDERIKEDEKHKSNNSKKSKESKKNSKEKKTHRAQSFSIDESLGKSQEQIIEKDYAKTEWIDGEEVLNRLDNRVKNQIDTNRQIDLETIDVPPDNLFSQIDILSSSSSFSSSQSDTCENFDDSLKDSARNNMGNIEQREIHDIDYDNTVPHLNSVSCTIDEHEKQVKSISDRIESNELQETNFDESIMESMITGETEDLSWTSEIDGKVVNDGTAESNSFVRRYIERTSSRINFPTDDQEKLKTKSSLTKECKNFLPSMKKKSSDKTDNLCVDEDESRGHKKTNKFGFKRTAAEIHEQKGKVRRKLNSCSFEVGSLERDKHGHGEKTRNRGDESMIPRLASPMRQGLNSIKNDRKKSEVKANGISFRVKQYVAYLRERERE